MIRVEDPEQMTLYRNYYRAAQRGDPVPSYNRLYEMLDISEGSGRLISLDRKLEEAGLIKRRTYQRSRAVFVVELDKWTARPMNESPHWRGAAVTIGDLRKQDLVWAMEIAAYADREGQETKEVLARLVWAGAEAIGLIQSQSVDVVTESVA